MVNQITTNKAMVGPRLLQDETQTYDSKGLSTWFATKANARQEARNAAEDIKVWPGCLTDSELATVGTGGSKEQHVYRFIESLTRLDNRWKFSTGNANNFKKSSLYLRDRKLLVDRLLSNLG